MIRDKIKKEMAALSPVAMLETEHAAKGYDLDVRVSPDQVVAAAEIMDRAGFFIEAVTGVDWLLEAKAAPPKPKAPSEAGEQPEGGGAAEEAAPTAPEMEVVYDFNIASELCRVVVRTRIPRDNPELPTIQQVYPGANWHERETHDFFGIKFVGHPNLTPFLLPEDADFHPLLKG
ncbi:MAG: NADH-quinone oxidoreductase subunit C [Desulfobacteraceae bacterium]|nr:NADH-quinone oxidoreductase subunit C [Desulfobacteraceae bacterium]